MMDPRELQLEIARTQVVVLAGGKARRMGIDLPKCLLEVSGKKLIDRCIECLAEEGFRKFVLLLGHKAELVIEHVGDGSRYGIEARYSVDPISNIGWGKGKAFKYALQNNGIEASTRSIILFPDDIILQNDVYSSFLESHLEVVRNQRALASIVMVRATQYPYGVAKVDSKGRIVKLVEKPLVRKPTSTGIYVFEPQVYKIVEESIDMEDGGAVELESTILPLLSEQHKLYGFFIASNKWLPINTLKEYDHALKVLAVR